MTAKEHNGKRHAQVMQLREPKKSRIREVHSGEIFKSLQESRDDDNRKCKNKTGPSKALFRQVFPAGGFFPCAQKCFDDFDAFLEVPLARNDIEVAFKRMDD